MAADPGTRYNATIMRLYPRRRRPRNTTPPTCACGALVTVITAVAAGNARDEIRSLPERVLAPHPAAAIPIASAATTSRGAPRPRVLAPAPITRPHRGTYWYLDMPPASDAAATPGLRGGNTLPDAVLLARLATLAAQSTDAPRTLGLCPVCGPAVAHIARDEVRDIHDLALRPPDQVPRQIGRGERSRRSSSALTRKARRTEAHPRTAPTGPIGAQQPSGAVDRIAEGRHLFPWCAELGRR